MSEKILFPIDKELLSDVQVCCDESGRDIEEIVNGAIGYALGGYLANRNDTFAKYTNEAIKEIYPGMNDDQCEMVRAMAKKGELGIIRPMINDSDSECHHGEGILCECGDVIPSSELRPVATEIKDKELIRTLKDVINTAHHVNVKIEIVQG